MRKRFVPTNALSTATAEFTAHCMHTYVPSLATNVTLQQDQRNSHEPLNPTASSISTNPPINKIRAYVAMNFASFQGSGYYAAWVGRTHSRED